MMIFPGLAATRASAADSIININAWVIGGLLRSARSATMAPPSPARPTASHSQPVEPDGSSPRVTTRSGAKIQYAADTKPITKANSDRRKSRVHCKALIGGGGAALAGSNGEMAGNIRQAARTPTAASTAKEK